MLFVWVGRKRRKTAKQKLFLQRELHFFYHPESESSSLLCLSKPQRPPLVWRDDPLLTLLSFQGVLLFWGDRAVSPSSADPTNVHDKKPLSPKGKTNLLYSSRHATLSPKKSNVLSWSIVLFMVLLKQKQIFKSLFWLLWMSEFVSWI